MDTDSIVLAAYHILTLLPAEPSQAQPVIALLLGGTTQTAMQKADACRRALVNEVEAVLPRSRKDARAILLLVDELLETAMVYVRRCRASASTSGKAAASSSRRHLGTKSSRP